jgi:hypothetical protein
MYLSDGREVVVHQEVENGILVEPMMEYYNYEGCPYCEPSGRLIIVNKVYNKAPTEVLDQRVVSLQKQIKNKRAELRLVEGDVRKAQDERDKIVQKLKAEHRALRQVDSFLNGEITHFVIYNDYGRLEIREFGEGIEYGHSWERKKTGMKLLVLFGASGGDLQWRLNKYKDGSSKTWYQVVPCSGYDVALEVAQRVLSEMAEDRLSQDLADLANKHGLELPDGYRERLKERAVKNAEEEVSGLERDLEKAKRKLQEIKES